MPQDANRRTPRRLITAFLPRTNDASFLPLKVLFSVPVSSRYETSPCVLLSTVNLSRLALDVTAMSVEPVLVATATPEAVTYPCTVGRRRWSEHDRTYLRPRTGSHPRPTTPRGAPR